MKHSIKIAPKPDSATLLWFTNDLRLHDNAALSYVSQLSDDNKHRLLCLYCIDEQWFTQDRFGLCHMGEKRWTFLLQSLQALAKELALLGQQLVVAKGKPESIVDDILSRYAITTVVTNRPVGYNEDCRLQSLRLKHSQHTFIEQENVTLFAESQLPFLLQDLPSHFSAFRQGIESTNLSLEKISSENISSTNISPKKKATNHIQMIRESLHKKPKKLPPIFHITLSQQHQFHWPNITNNDNILGFYGGENQGLAHIHHYFSSAYPLDYKNTRNALDCEQEAWQHSGKFSPWLANGCVSARQIIDVLHHYEINNGANESTYWIQFELLWREYFQWYARKHGYRLFTRSGIQQQRPLASFYPQRFQQWCKGSTPWPLVNACINQLNQTGFLSNRGRQIVASVLINELAVDWRCGAAYFEQQLIDYDVAANWGNWQYIAGVGADPRGGRHFSITKQQQLYDPDNSYINRWQGNANHLSTMDSVDAADWPITTNKNAIY